MRLGLKIFGQLASRRCRHAERRETQGLALPEQRREYPLASTWSRGAEQVEVLLDRNTVAQAIGSLGKAPRQDQLWAAGRCNPRPYVARLGGATTLAGSRIVIDSSEFALSDELMFAMQEFGLPPKMPELQLLVGPRISLPEPTELLSISAGVHLTGEHEQNYFHWVVEVLPRLFLYDLLRVEDSTPLIVTDGLHPNHYRLLELVKDEERPVLLRPRGSWTRVAQLIYPSDVSRILDVYDRAPNEETVFIPVTLIRAMARRVTTSVPAGPVGPKRIFLKRASSYRNLMNSDEVEALLKDLDFSIVDPGQLAVDEQVRLFRNADLIVGPSGAAFANIAWCSPRAQILVLHSDHPFKAYPYLSALARSAEASIGFLSGPRAHLVTGQFAPHDSFHIPLDSLKKAVDQLR